MKPGNFTVSDDGLSMSATIVVQASIAAKIFLYSLNILLIAVIILFTVGGIGIIVLFIVAFEILFFSYSLWNLYGSETIFLNQDLLKHQQSYGLFKTPLKTIKINKSIKVIPFHENFQTGNRAMKLIFESLDDSNEPVNLYQTSLAISEQDYHLFMGSFKHLFMK